MPSFAISTLSRGEFEFGGIGFDTLQNTRTIRSGTLRAHYWDELASPTSLGLTADIDAASPMLELNSGSAIGAGDLLQLGRELVRVLAVEPGGQRLEVERGVHQSPPSVHLSGEAVYPLAQYVSVFTFPSGFFGSAAGAGFLPRISLPNARIAAVEFFVTNSRGESPTSAVSYTGGADAGLRTMAGGQFVIQFEGGIATTDSIAPPLVTDGVRVIRDVRATVGQAPVGSAITVRLMAGGIIYANLTILAGARGSNIVSGFGRKPLPEGSELIAGIVSIPKGGGTDPGRDLTVTVRL
jgi:hypothetical protein